MQYFIALKLGEKRVKRIPGSVEFIYWKFSNACFSLKDTKTNVWFPVGEENLIAVFKETSGYVIVICDKNGIAKTMAQWFSEEDKDICIRGSRRS